ncbi:MAG: hypothetical protein K8W52_12795 [Deltaproteobacteria bacterium]|nr:hypothetical protein [Deltaproteobacteria bacterium]
MRYALGLMLFVACARPDIDPAPYDEPCTTPPDSCPQPYACTLASTLVGTSLRCYVPCVHDDDCGDGFLCNGDTHQVNDSGPPIGFCFLGT